MIRKGKKEEVKDFIKIMKQRSTKIGKGNKKRDNGLRFEMMSLRLRMKSDDFIEVMND